MRAIGWIWLGAIAAHLVGSSVMIIRLWSQGSNFSRHWRIAHVLSVFYAILMFVGVVFSTPNPNPNPVSTFCVIGAQCAMTGAIWITVGMVHDWFS